MKKSRLIAISLLAGTTWVLTGGCSSSGANGNAPGGPNNNGGASLGGSGGSSSVITGGHAGDATAGKPALNPLCGVADQAGECVPDNPSACVGYTPPSSAGGDGAGGAAAGAEGGAAQGGAAPGGAAQAGAPQGGEPASAAGQSGAAGAGQAGDASGGAGGEGGAGPQHPQGFASFSCQVTSQNNLLTRQCVAAGSGTANAPCFGAADCAPSFACVTDGDAGRCLPYCCNAQTTCAPGTYCAEQPLRRALAGGSNTQAPRVPVCVPADGCSLEDQFPCPAGETCRCQGDTACMVVRSDGTTACIKPGSGQQGDACPCAWNHVCSSVTNTCVKICRTDAAKNDCGTQKCQASAELPPNFGVCVGPV
jgi:hypothetical protein